MLTFDSMHLSLNALRLTSRSGRVEIPTTHDVHHHSTKGTSALGGLRVVIHGCARREAADLSSRHTKPLQSCFLLSTVHPLRVPSSSSAFHLFCSCSPDLSASSRVTRYRRVNHTTHAASGAFVRPLGGNLAAFGRGLLTAQHIPGEYQETKRYRPTLPSECMDCSLLGAIGCCSCTQVLQW